MFDLGTREENVEHASITTSTDKKDWHEKLRAANLTP
jgi:hypothetical protein